MELEAKKKIIFQVVLFVAFFAFAFFATNYFLSGKAVTSNAILLEVSRKMNQDLPKMMDVETRLDSTSVEDKTLNYHYTLVNFPKEGTEFDFQNVKLEMIKKAQENLDNSAEMKQYRDNDFSLHYIYVDNNKNPIFDYIVTNQKKQEQEK